MIEKITQQPREGEEMTEKNLTEYIRGKLVNELKEVLEKSRPDWVNRESCTNLIENLEGKKPTKISGPFYGDFLDGVLHDMGIQTRSDGRYEKIWGELEKGEGKKE